MRPELWHCANVTLKHHALVACLRDKNIHIHTTSELAGRMTETGAEVGSLNDIVFSAEDVVDFMGASLAEGGCGTVKERFGQFLFAARTGLHFLHVWQGASS